jgi:hypothetical protein
LEEMLRRKIYRVEKKGKINLKVSTKFQINLSTNAWETGNQSNMGMDRLTDRQTNGQTDQWTD